jgi:predicted methyltransferase
MASWQHRAAAITILSLLCLAITAHAAERYELREEHDPDGIGKFYMGREIAHVMGPGGIAWLERPERDTEEQTNTLIEALDIEPGQTIADFGAGSGYHTFKIAPLVGPSGKVLAVDIEPAMLELIADRARRERAANVTTVRSTAREPNLPPKSIDLLFMVDVYHELEYPYETLAQVRHALKPGGKVALVEYRLEDPGVMIKTVHKMSEQQIIKELQAAGFKYVKTVSTLPLQHLVIFVNRD